jgi:hypothetical protein
MRLNPVARDGKQEYIRRALNLILENNQTKNTKNKTESKLDWSHIICQN